VSPYREAKIAWRERGGKEEGKKRERRGKEEGKKRERRGKEEGKKREVERD
jgi:hypothetical protein